MTQIPAAMQALIDDIAAKVGPDTKLAKMFAACFTNTYRTTLQPQQDGTTFVITGDIPAMWLRDSAAQVRPYLLLAAQDEQIAALVAGVVRRQMAYVVHDPYANAFNETANGKGFQDDVTAMTPLVWERKYEIDSLCYPIQLAYLLWQTTGQTAHLDAVCRAAVHKIVALWRTEQDHEASSPYRFERKNVRASDTLTRDGKGPLVAKTGMTWSAFRPSDDACTYGYLIPANMFAVVALAYAAEIADTVWHDAVLAEEARQLAAEIDEGIKRYGTVEHPQFGTIYAYETDGRGNYNLMDDANVPSLLAMPYVGYVTPDDPIYLNTRRFLLSVENPFYYAGDVARGIGSPHTPPHYIWHIALAVQGMTATDEAEREDILATFQRTDAGTHLMHEGFHVDDPTHFTREWFAWANAMFSEFVLSMHGYYVKGSPLARFYK